MPEWSSEPPTMALQPGLRFTLGLDAVLVGEAFEGFAIQRLGSGVAVNPG